MNSHAALQAITQTYADAALEAQVITAMLLMRRHFLSLAFTELDETDFAKWPCREIFAALRRAWLAGRLCNDAQLVAVLLQTARLERISNHEWLTTLQNIWLLAEQWPYEFDLQSNCRRLKLLTKQRLQAKIMCEGIATVMKAEKAAPGEFSRRIGKDVQTLAQRESSDGS